MSAAEPWRQRLLAEVINRLHTSNAPAAFRRAGGAATLRSFAFLLAAADAPARASDRNRATVIAARFGVSVTDGLRDAAAYFGELLSVDEGRQTSPIGVLCKCRIIEDVETELAGALHRATSRGAR